MKRISALTLSFILILAATFSVSAKEYTIQSGDVLWKIARDNDTSIEALVEANSITDANRIYAGDTLTIPGTKEVTTEATEVFTPVTEEVTDTPLTMNWELEGEFVQPESILYIPNHPYIYVANVNDQDLGFISRLTLDGQVDTYRFAEGIPLALGMAYNDGFIYIASSTSVKVVDIETGETVNELKAPTETGMLNDITMTPDGDLYASDTVTHQVYKSNGTALEVWLEADQFSALNGIFYDEGALLLSNIDMEAGTGIIHHIDIATKEITDYASTADLGPVDGIDKYGDNYIASAPGTGELILFNMEDSWSIGQVDGGMADIYVNAQTMEIYLPLISINKVASYSVK